MAKGRIKGITVEIGGDTVGLEKALSQVNKKSADLQKELRDVERLLKFNPGNTEALAQKQKLLADQVANTSDKLKQLKQAEEQVQQQFKNGKISEEQYRSFRREIEFTESSLNSAKQKMADMKAEQEKVANSTKMLNTLFDATGTSVDRFANTLGGRLVTAIRNGEASSKQLEKAIELIGKEALGSSADIDKMKQALSSVDGGASLKSVKKELSNVAKEAKTAKKEVSEFNVELENMLGAAVAGGGIAGAVSQALDTTSLDAKIDITFEVPESSMASVKAAVRGVEAYGVDAESALEGVRRQWALNKDASDESNAAIVKGAGVIAASYAGIDFTELIQETNEISKALKISNEDALALTNSLLKAGFPPEQLDIIAEYGTQLQMAGYNAEEIQAIMSAGVDTGTWNIDNLLDGLKEGRIKVAEFGQEVPKALKDLLKGTDISAKQMQEWGKAVAKGGEGGSKAMQEIAKALNGVEDETKKNALGVQIFGTMYEDQGQNIIDTLLNAQTATVDLKANQDELNESTGKLDATPAVQMQQALADLKTALEPLLGVIASVISAIATWASNNPTLAATITAIVAAVGIFLGILLALAPVFALITGLATTLGISIGAIMAPILIAVAAIAALIAIGVALYKNWDTIVTKAGELKEKVVNKFQELKTSASEKIESMKQAVSDKFEEAKQKASEIVESLKNAVRDKFESMRNAISDKLNSAKSTITQIWGNIKSFFTSTLANLLSTTTGKFQDIVGAVRQKMTDVYNKVKDLWNKAESFLKGVDLKSIGSDMIKGLINGVGSMAKSLVSKVEGVVGDAVSAAKNLLGIHSPSRVFMEIGEFTGEGYEIGLDSMVTSIKKASEKMAAAAVPAIPKFKVPKVQTEDNTSRSVSANNQPASNQINFAGLFNGANFHVRNNDDIEQIARKLAEHIARKGRGAFG